MNLTLFLDVDSGWKCFSRFDYYFDFLVMIRTLLFHCLLYQKMTDSSEANQHLVNDQFEMKPVQISMPDHLNCTPFSKWILFFSSVMYLSMLEAVWY